MTQPQPVPLQVVQVDGGTLINMVGQVLNEQGKMSAQLGVIDERLKDLPDHEARLRILEGTRNRIIGGAAVAGALFGGGAGYLTVLLSHH